jgi:hypothetical protein
MSHRRMQCAPLTATEIVRYNEQAMLTIVSLGLSLGMLGLLLGLLLSTPLGGSEGNA